MHASWSVANMGLNGQTLSITFIARHTYYQPVVCHYVTSPKKPYLPLALDSTVDEPTTEPVANRSNLLRLRQLYTTVISLRLACSLFTRRYEASRRQKGSVDRVH